MTKTQQREWWEGQAQDGFTALCSQKFGEFIDAETADSIKVLVLRSQLLAAVVGIQQSKQNMGVMHANVVRGG
jgi:hypothetical protein